jgi:NAD-dependent SIR2 family protein deacetylase
MESEEILNEYIEKIARWIIDSEHIVAFTGAGMSTDSGIPDYRGPNGVWTRRDAGLPPPAVKMVKQKYSKIGQ